jgi:hypothetical protein
MNPVIFLNFKYCELAGSNAVLPGAVSEGRYFSRGSGSMNTIRFAASLASLPGSYCVLLADLLRRSYLA